MGYNSLPATDAEEYAIEVDDVSMIFNIASEVLTNLKEYFIKAMRHELFFKEFRAARTARASRRCSSASRACWSPARATSP